MVLLKGVDNYERGDIKALYFGAKILITGASGFLGKVLIESLLTKTDVEKVFVLIRNKRNKSTSERLKDILTEPIFQRLKRENPDRLSAIFPVNGDVSLPQLGISEVDRQKLIDEVEIVFHAAATVTFNENLKLATEINVSGTKSIMDLARDMRNLKVIMHVSTAYSNCHLKEIDEKIYPVSDKIDLINLAGSIDRETAHNITNQIIEESPNTYVFTKRVAEDLIEKHYKDMPVGILRPGVVIGSLNEPMPGWVDNLYGPTGLVIGIMAGIIHFTVIRQDALADIVPVDFVTNCLIASAWDTYSKFIMNGKEKTVPVYNVVSSPLAPTTWGRFQNGIVHEGRRAATSGSAWFSFAFSTTFWPIFRFFTFFLHYLPALICDKLLTVTGKKAKWVRMFRRVDDVMNVLIPFCTNQWVFKVHTVEALWNKMSKQERELFPFNFKGFDWDRYLDIYFKGVKKFMVKNTIPDDEGVKLASRFFYFHSIFVSIATGIFAVIAFKTYYLFNDITA